MLKTIGYTTENGAMEIAAISNVIPYLEQRDEIKPGRVSWEGVTMDRFGGNKEKKKKKNKEIVLRICAWQSWNVTSNTIFT